MSQKGSVYFIFSFNILDNESWRMYMRTMQRLGHKQRSLRRTSSCFRNIPDKSTIRRLELAKVNMMKALIKSWQSYSLAE